jgi:hypothetical protein
MNRYGLPLLGRIARWRIVQTVLWEAHRSSQPAHFDWQFWKRYTQRWFPKIRLKPYQSRAIYGALLAVIFFAALVAIFVLVRRSSITPEATLLAYYDDLDFKRFTQSYDHLLTPLSRAEYLRWLSQQGGILASFAKLDNLNIEVTPTDNEQVRAHVDADWLTALGTYTVTTDYDMQLTSTGWRIVFDVEPPPLPRETLVTQSSTISYFDTPLSTLEDTALARGVLDRSLLSVGEVHAVYAPDAPVSFTPESYDAGRVQGRFEGVISIIGAVTNRDTLPAQVSVSALLRNADGERLAETNVMDVFLHQLLPGETSPFRIDFSGADAAQIAEISDIASVEVSVQGVPTAYNLERPLILIASNTLYNAGALAVDIPRVLTTFFDTDKQLLWVEGTYLSSAITPDQTTTYSSPSLPEGLRMLPLPIHVDGPRLTDWTGTLPAQVIYGYSR